MDALLNTTTLRELHDILGDELHGIAALFAQQLEQDARVLQACVDQADWAAVARHAHSIKGSSGNVGAAGLSQWAAALEKSAKLGLVPETTQLAQQLPDLLERTLAALRQSGYLLPH